MTTNSGKYEMPILMSSVLSGEYSLAVGMMNIRELVQFHKIDHSDHKKPSGYQREPSNARIRQISRVLTNKNPMDIVLPITLNFRNFEPQKHMKNNGTVLVIDSSSDLYVVDGQHRVKGFEKFGGGNHRSMFVQLILLSSRTKPW